MDFAYYIIAILALALVLLSAYEIGYHNGVTRAIIEETHRLVKERERKENGESKETPCKK